jgi:hypothetical protein
MREMVGRLVFLFACAFTTDLYAQTSSELPLRTQRDIVHRLYDVISAPQVDARSIYATLTVDLQADLWTFQLERFLAENPDLTPEQYGVTAEAIGLLSSGVHHHIATGESEDAARALAAMSNLTTRIQKAFLPSEGIAFAQLGRSAVDSASYALARGRGPDHSNDQPLNHVGRVAANAQRREVTPNAECECNTESDWCTLWQSPTAPINDCVARPMTCTRTPAGCGTFWEYGCNGICSHGT